VGDCTIEAGTPELVLRTVTVLRSHVTVTHPFGLVCRVFKIRIRYRVLSATGGCRTPPSQ